MQNTTACLPTLLSACRSYVDLAPETFEFTVRVSYFEIYMERIRDLLCDANVNLQVRTCEAGDVH